ncbi:FAD binding domain-containing protein [Pseudonocardia xishanensis]|uniref:FAD binding domain-containing protein n=1 Tax=Pseudonocardia xishanensis TaxID=630995 RepID=A0ABP8RZI6_9PSEU
MKPPRFRYVRPTTLDEALDLRADEDIESVILAGGQSLIPMMNFRLARPELVIDIGGIKELRAISRTTDALVVGAGTRQADALIAPEVASGAPLFIQALRHVGHVAIRNRGTVGGSIAHADPAAELPVALLALDGSVVAQDRSGRRTVRATELFETAFTTSLRSTEILVEVHAPVEPRAQVSFVEISRRHGDFALVSAAVSTTVDDGRFSSVRIALGGVAHVPVRCEAAEQLALEGGPTADHIREVARAAAAGIDPSDDFHATAAYRRQVTAVLVERAITDTCGVLTEVA